MPEDGDCSARRKKIAQYILNMAIAVSPFRLLIVQLLEMEMNH
jgi:hypothetical protein